MEEDHGQEAQEPGEEKFEEEAGGEEEAQLEEECMKVLERACLRAVCKLYEELKLYTIGQHCIVLRRSGIGTKESLTAQYPFPISTLTATFPLLDEQRT